MANNIRYLNYCPKCGKQGFARTNEEICAFCGEKEILTQYEADKWLWKDCYPKNLNEIIFNEYIKPNPLFDEELYAQREGRDKMLQEATLRKQKEIKQNTLSCPKCGSTAVSVGQRGYNLLTGFLGSGQTMNRCGKCGHKWTPRG